MSYFTQGTGSTEEKTAYATQSPLRKLTQSQGARSPIYETVQDRTEEVMSWVQVKRKQTGAAAPSRETVGYYIAEREHVGRLLRECKAKAEALCESTDPIESGLLGVTLSDLLNDLWEHRSFREDDWVEILNVLQIVLPRAEFEVLPQEKRLGLVKVFNEVLLPRTVGRREVEHALQILTSAGFDIWCGLETTNEETV